MEKVLELMVNGKPQRLDLNEPADLPAVLAALDLKQDRIAVEHNGQIVRRSAWQQTLVRSGDKLEVVHFVGGGA